MEGFGGLLVFEDRVSVTWGGFVEGLGFKALLVRRGELCEGEKSL